MADKEVYLYKGKEATWLEYNNKVYELYTEKDSLMLGEISQFSANSWVWQATKNWCEQIPIPIWEEK